MVHNILLTVAQFNYQAMNNGHKAFFKHIRLVIFVQKLQKWTSKETEHFTQEFYKQENLLLYLCNFWHDFKILLQISVPTHVQCPLWLIIGLYKNTGKSSHASYFHFWHSDFNNTKSNFLYKHVFVCDIPL
jgi:hypothetical protein